MNTHLIEILTWHHHDSKRMVQILREVVAAQGRLTPPNITALVRGTPVGRSRTSCASRHSCSCPSYTVGGENSTAVICKRINLV